jgi:hypothetical protein
MLQWSATANLSSFSEYAMNLKVQVADGNKLTVIHYREHPLA